MSSVSIEGDELVLRFEGWRRLCALRSRLAVPLDHVVSAHHDPGLTLGWLDRLKLIGAYVPGHLAVGTFNEDGAIVFYDVCDAARTVVIELRDECWARLVVDVPDPDALTRHLRRRHAAPASRSAPATGP